MKDLFLFIAMLGSSILFGTTLGLVGMHYAKKERETRLDKNKEGK